MDETTNFKLRKPAPEDFYNVQDFNDNMDIIDTEIKAAQDKADLAFRSASDGKEKIKTAITGVDNDVIIPNNPTFQQLADCIMQIETGIDTSDATATAEFILANFAAYIKNAKVIGTMPNNGAVNHSLPINGSFTIPKGYHNGSGKVSQSITTKGAQTYTPGTADQTIAAGQYLSGAQTIKGDANLMPANILSGKSIFGVAGSVIAGKRFATGVVTNSTSNHESPFKEGNGGGNYYRSYILVSQLNLNFIPSVILLVTSGVTITFTNKSSYFSNGEYCSINPHSSPFALSNRALPSEVIATTYYGTQFIFYAYE